MKQLRTIMALVLFSLIASSCSHIVGYAGQHPGYIKCKGKGTITGLGTLAAGVGIGGSGTNSFSITADCGDGLELEQGNPVVSPGTPK